MLMVLPEPLQPVAALRQQPTDRWTRLSEYFALCRGITSIRHARAKGGRWATRSAVYHRQQDRLSIHYCRRSLSSRWASGKKGLPSL